MKVRVELKNTDGSGRWLSATADIPRSTKLGAELRFQEFPGESWTMEAIYPLPADITLESE
jgi:hypothetical protein